MGYKHQKNKHEIRKKKLKFMKVLWKLYEKKTHEVKSEKIH